MSHFSLDKSRDNYCVLGNPVEHSKSPQIHSAFARQTLQDIYYQKIKVPIDKFSVVLDEFTQQGGKGVNVTLPFKEEAWNLCAKLSERARLAKAVNVLQVLDGELHGDNTDGIGLVRDLIHNHQITLRGSSILIMGAGGAVRGILGPLLEQNPASIVIANRTHSKASLLKESYSDFKNLQVRKYEDLDSFNFDLVLNGTSASIKGEIPPISESLLSSHPVCYDLMYAEQDTVFIKWAHQHNINKAINGLGMLVEQAAETFHIWRGIRPDTTDIIQSLRNGTL